MSRAVACREACEWELKCLAMCACRLRLSNAASVMSLPWPAHYPTAGSLSIEKIRAKGLSWRDMFVDIPITVHNSPMAAALAAEIAPPSAATTLDCDRCEMRAGSHCWFV